ncbi:aromatic-ring-hydroxylating dioxygenase subunit beta [Aurantimonas sp. VKM B-3413]|uniref:aromatic-ring-hydroxylating dioxygenase subunit beta n=1 Tax=Aurantimonas sp. VKM B-3413 TaxID=2779401 RepID=UPI001E518B91|nr:aromatic-ring-hydroxylating dioxygenase subunit beta [Aurantimonas sp. VKM B-3413]MCB8840305.1 aromatic-ring-hydroxylating dioxygenase subunit beta [Aurantimonas sp. VKM B-3413]
MTEITEKDLVDFVYREARLLDELRYEEWLSLYAEDAHYWMPAEWQQTDPRLQPSLMYEDMLLLRIRVERLAGNRTYSQKPRSRAQHLLQAPQIDEMNAAENRYRTWTSFHYAETRGDEFSTYAGWARHELRVEDGELKIVLKRVDLVNFDAPFGNIQLFM